MADESRIALQEELNARGLDLHLSTAFTSKDKYYSHTTDAIASGFFLSDGTAISLYDKLKDIADSLSAIQASLSTASAESVQSSSTIRTQGYLRSLASFTDFRCDAEHPFQPGLYLIALTRST
jgi:hypothetical protein